MEQGRMNKMVHDEFSRVARLMKSLAHPLRLEIVCGLRNHPCTQTFIAEKLGIPQPTVAQHLRVLRQAGILRSRRKGLEVLLEVSDPEVEGVIDAICRKRSLESFSGYTWDEIADCERLRRVSGEW